MNDVRLRDRLFELFPPDSEGDWDDVLRRSALRSRSVRRLYLLVAAALFAVQSGEARLRTSRVEAAASTELAACSRSAAR